MPVAPGVNLAALFGINPNTGAPIPRAAAPAPVARPAAPMAAPVAAQPVAPAPVAQPAAAPAAPAVQPGGLPVNTVAAQTPWQKEALTGLAAPQTAGNDLMGLIQKQLEQVGGYLEKSTAPMTAEGFQTGVNQYMDPYRQQVVDSTVGEISKEGERARARIMAANGGDDSSSTGVQLSELDRNIADAIAKATGSLSSEGFNNAANMTKGFYDTNTGNAGSAAQVSTALPAITSGVANTQRNNAIDDLKNKLFAGTAVQDQNQALLDAVTGKFGESQGFDLEMVQKLAELLGKTPTAGGGTSTNPYPNTAEKIGTTLQSSGVQDLLKEMFG